MARSKSQKQRAHKIRQGRRDPEENRGSNSDFSMHTRRTKTRVEIQNVQRRREDKNIIQNYA